MGERIGRLVPRGDLGLFASLPDAEEVARTIAGVRSALAGRAGTIRVVATGEDVSTQVARVDATVQKRKGLAGLFGVDGGSTVGIALAAKKYGLAHANVQAGGAGVLPPTLQAVQDGSLAFTTDQQPYLQGFLPVVQLFLAKVSGGLVQPVDADTGHVFVTKANVGPYLATRTRFEGSSSKPQAVGTH
jgi:simple sugar transport system substrate-binding protein